MVAPVIFSGKFAGLLSQRGVLTGARNELAFNGARDYLPGQMQDFVVANDVVTLAGATANRTTNTTKWRQSAASLVALETSVNLTPTQSIKLTLTGTDETQFVETPMFTLDRIDAGTNIYFAIETEPSGTFAVNDIDVIAVNYNSSGTFVSRIAIQGITNSSGFTATGGGQIPASKTIIRGFFVATSTTTDQYSLRFRSGNASARSLVIGDYFVGPTLQPIPSINVIGRTDGVAPTLGKIGEVIQVATGASQNAAASGTLLPFASVSLTPGSWRLEGSALLQRNSATLDTSGNWIACISPTSGSTTGSTAANGEMFFPQGILTADIVSSVTITGVIVNLSVTTTYYLNLSVTYTVSAPRFYGSITATRIA